MVFFFWTSLGLIIYTYLCYPLLLMAWARLGARPVRKGGPDTLRPFVSVVVSAWNEERVMARRIEDLLDQDYPADRIEILIGSDGCTDRTDEIVSASDDPRLKLVHFSERRGKMSVINDLMQQARGEIVLFTDARQVFKRNAVSELVRNFADETVGCVSGRLVLSDGLGATAQGVNLYWRYEKFMRRLEAQIHSMLGATGAIYAIRKDLFTPLPKDLILDDMYIPLGIVLKGYRAVFDRDAVAYDKVVSNAQQEARRKNRTLFGNYQLFARLPQVFVPWRSPVALQIFSHKFLRVIAPFLLIAAFVLNVLLARHSLVYAGLMVLQVLFYFMAVTGAFFRYECEGWKRMVRNICYAPFVFCLLNFSALVGFFRFLSGRQSVTWEK